MVRRAAAPTPDITFIKVQDALAKDGCPICHAAREVTRRFLWGYLYERVNDPPSREELLASRGFCARHAWALRQFHDAFGVAILYHHLLQDLARDIRRSGGAPVPRRRRGSGPAAALRLALRPKGECPACAHVKQMEDNALHALVMRLEAPAVFDRLSGPAGLCLPHFLAALTLADAGASARLLQAELAVLDTVTQHLAEFIRKHDYRFSNEGITPEEGRSWTRAIELLVGAPSLEDSVSRGP